MKLKSAKSNVTDPWCPNVSQVHSFFVGSTVSPIDSVPRLPNYLVSASRPNLARCRDSHVDRASLQMESTVVYKSWYLHTSTYINIYQPTYINHIINRHVYDMKTCPLKIHGNIILFKHNVSCFFRPQFCGRRGCKAVSCPNEHV